MLWLQAIQFTNPIEVMQEAREQEEAKESSEDSLMGGTESPTHFFCYFRYE